MNNKQNEFVQAIRTQYAEKTQTEFDALQALDRKVKRPVKVFAYLFGTVAALVMGGGMSLIMTDIGQLLGIGAPMLPGILLGLLGMAAAILNYPLCRAWLGSRRKKYAAEILALSDRIAQD